MKNFIFILIWIFFISCQGMLFVTPINADDKKDVELFLDKYFLSWSSGDITTYGSLFHKNSQIQYQDPYGNILSESLSVFLKNQKAAIVDSNERLIEVPISKELRFKDKVCYAIVKWQLTARNTNRLGYDHFILSKSEGSWKIQFIYFYSE